jgi:hypothetical protein
VVQGARQRRHQIVRCRACGQSLFILALSPLPPPDGSVEQAGPGQPLVSPWRRPLRAALATLTIVILIFALLFLLLPPRPSASPEEVREHIATGQEQLARGEFHNALEEFDVAQRQARANPGALTPAEERQLQQWRRQARLLASLLRESLGEILASRSDDKEWQDRFDEQYKSRAVVFDAEVHRDGEGQYHLDWELLAGAEPAKLEIGDLTMLKELPLDEPKRLLFGARLGKVAREHKGVWVVRFEPDSGVLFTDQQAAAACCPMDDKLLEVLKRQREWLKQ